MRFAKACRIRSVRLPLLQQILGHLDLVGCSGDGDDALVVPIGCADIDSSSRFLADAVNSLPTLSDDGSS